MSKVKSILLYLVLSLISLIMIFPLFWMLLLSLKDFPEQYSGIIELLFSSFTFKNFSDTLTTDSFLVYFLNSLVVAFFVTSGNVIFCFMTAYALERKNFKINSFVFLTILGVLIIPQHIVMIPLYRLVVNLGWINTYFALVVPWVVTPFGIFMIKQFLQQVPVEIEEAARVDGCSDWKIIFRIVMPLCKPILIVLGIYTFLTNWNSFLFPFILTNEEEMRTLPVGLAFYLGKQSIDWGHLMAGASFSALPVILLFLFFQKYVIKGLIQGALKE